VSRHLTTALLWALSVVVAQVGSAQSPPATTKWVDSVTKLIDAGMSTGQPSGLDQAIALLDRVLTATPNDAIMLHYKGYALYRKANPMMADDTKKAEVKALLEAAEDALESSAKTLQWPETWALRASVSGQMIAVGNPISGMVLGPRAETQIQKALELGPNNPRVWMLKGVGSMFKPKMFGGGVDKAEKELLKAIELFANDRPASPLPGWGHAESYAWLGQAYVAQNKFAEARAAYRKTLELDPGNGWVTQLLLPALEKKAR
jgi:tetratricopeptide (TPR) repeat protein